MLGDRVDSGERQRTDPQGGIRLGEPTKQNEAERRARPGDSRQAKRCPIMGGRLGEKHQREGCYLRACRSRRPLAMATPLRFASVVDYGRVRRCLHLGVIASLLLAFAQAPIEHVHDGDDHQRENRGPIHAHWDVHHSDQSDFEEVDRDSAARLLDWFSGDGAAPVKFVPNLPESVVLPLPVVASTFLLEFTPNNHDPPWRLSLQSRAPPA